MSNPFAAKNVITDKKSIEKRDIKDILPEWLSTNEDIEKVFDAVINPMYQPSQEEEVNGYIGHLSKNIVTSDVYVQEKTSSRQHYQLEPIMVSRNNQNEVQTHLFYQDLIDILRNQGSLTNNHARLFSSNAWSWCPPINVDMIINYSNYYWCPNGPVPITISTSTNVVTDVIGNTNATLGTTVLQSGMKIVLTNDANTEYNNIPYIVENVGKSIKLIDDSEWASSSDNVKDYFVMERGSSDLNQWSFNNRWFHVNQLKGVTNSLNTTAYQAKRPIIQYNSGLYLYNSGYIGRKAVDVVYYRIASLDEIVGQENVVVDGIPLEDGMRILFLGPNTSEQDTIQKAVKVNGKFVLKYETDGFNGISRGTDYEVVRVRKGTVYGGKTFYYLNYTWHEAQNKTTKNQYPLFNLYDHTLTSFNDTGVYPSSTFTGCKLFSYDVKNTSATDSETGVKLYKNSYSSYVFNNNLTTDNTDGIRLYYNFETKEYGTDWNYNSKGTRQDIISRWDMYKQPTSNSEEYVRTYTLDVKPQTDISNGPTLYVTINNKVLVENTDYSIDATILRISDSYNFTDGDILQTKVYNRNTNVALSDNSYYEIPINLQSNIKNENITTIAMDELIEHFISIIERQSGIVGKGHGINNYNSTIRNTALGSEIVKTDGSMIKLMTTSSLSYLNMRQVMNFVANSYNSYYTKFRTLINTMANNSEYTSTSTTSTIVDTILQTINVGKDSSFPFYNSGMIKTLSFIPATSAFLGLSSAYKPEIFNDTSLVTPVDRLRCHDGSIVDLYGNFRDNALLEFENRIYDSINSKFLTIRPLFNKYDVIPGKFRTTEYSRSEWNTLISRPLNEWLFNNKYDITKNTTYIEGNKSTWNWSSIYDKDGEPLPGHIRGILLWYYDTERPHTNPWEMLGFTIKPDWWEDKYGKSPYTNQNSTLWKDLANGYIADGDFKGTYDCFKRNGLLSCIPVDDVGNLLLPNQSGITTDEPNIIDAKSNWKIGDVSPLEWLWRTSSDFGYMEQLSLYLAKPAKWCDVNWNTTTQQYLFQNTTYMQYVDDLYNPITTEDIVVHNENGTLNYGYQQWLSDNLNKENLDISDNFGNYLREASTSLGYLSGSYINTDKLSFKSEVFGELESNDFNVDLNISPSRNEPSYSAIIIEWDGTYYRVTGYDPTNRYFNVLLPNKAKLSTNVVIGKFNLTMYTSYTNKTKSYEYGYGFSSVASLFEFIIGYSSYLKQQGFTFDYVDDNNVAYDWERLAKNFLLWADGTLNEGDKLFLSAAYNQVSFISDFGMIDGVPQYINGGWSIYDLEGTPLTNDAITVNRIGSSIVVDNDTSVPLAFIRFKRIEMEHYVLFQNTTKFGDVLYIPKYNARIKRLKYIAERVSGWDGTLFAPGYIVRRSGLLSNPEKMATDFIKYYDNYSVGLNSKLDEYAKKIIGFQPTGGYKNLLGGMKNQFDFYKGVLKTKGTNQVYNKITRSNVYKQDTDITISEEWAFLLGKYGSIDLYTTTEFLIGEGDITTDPLVVQYNSETTLDDKDYIITIGKDSDKWLKKTMNDNFTFRSLDSNINDYPSAGPVLYNEPTLITKTLDDYTLTLDNIGNQIWVTFDTNEWGFYKVKSLPSITSMSHYDTYTTITFATVHNFTVNDRFYLIDSSSTSPNLKGINKILEIVDTTSIKISNVIDADITYTDDNRPTGVSLFNRRFKTIPTTTLNDVNDYCYVDRTDLKTLTYSDTNNVSSGVKTGEHRWSVFKWTSSLWDLIRVEQPKLDVRLIESVYAYSDNIAHTVLQIFDPIKRLIPGSADVELYYKLETDPAKYTSITDIETWGEEQVGRLWWDLSTVKYYDYEQSDIGYRRKFWGKLVEGSTIDIYEWTKSPVSPYAWDKYVTNNSSVSGTVLNADNPSYVEQSSVNEYGITTTYYYFWVINSITLPNKTFRKITASNVAQIITSPHKTGLPWFAPLSSDGYDNYYTVGNFYSFLNTEMTIQINRITTTDIDKPIHKQWVLIKNDGNDDVNDTIWDKMKDSLLGYDKLNAVVPDTTLNTDYRYGISIRPRQSMFKDMYMARKIFVKTLNDILLIENVVENDVYWDSVFLAGEVYPTYDIKTSTITTRDKLLDTTTIVIGTTVLVETDSTFNGKWVLYTYAGNTTWTTTDKQSYRMSDYYDIVDWYKDGYTSTTPLTYTFDTIAKRAACITATMGDIAKVLDNGSGVWLLCILLGNGTWETIGLEDGTVQFKSTLYTESTDSYTINELNQLLSILIDYIKGRDS